MRDIFVHMDPVSENERLIHTSGVHAQAHAKTFGNSLRSAHKRLSRPGKLKNWPASQPRGLEIINTKKFSGWKVVEDTRRSAHIIRNFTP